MEQHRTERCSRRNYLCPIFAEFFPEAGQPLTEAMALNRVAVLPAFGPNVNSGDDFWSPAGKDKMERIEADPLAPPPLRSGKHLTSARAFEGVRQFEVRRANTLAQRAFKSLTKALEEHCLCFVCQPWHSYLWYFPEAQELRERRQVFSTSLPLCFFGGDQRWVEILHNSPAVHNSLYRAECLVHGESAKAWYEGSGRMTFECCEELAFPPQLAEAAAEIIAPLAQEILEDPQGHLRKMLSRGHYRGTEVRLMAPGEPDNLKMVPYPAHLWRWRNTLSFAWQNEDNITTLEMLAALAEIRRRARQLGTQGTRFFHVLDSQVKYHIMAKERAHSKRLNRLARRMMAVQLGGQLQALALWTISALNFADTASRRFAPHHGS
eukprot:s312_g11.t1